MSEQGTRRKHLRWRYIVDWRSQVGVTSQVVGVMSGICIMYAFGVFFLTQNSALLDMGPDAFRAFLLKVNAIYLIASATIFSVLTILLTHRFVGPAVALERAVRLMLKGERGRQITLRKRDYLRPLAKSLEELRVELDKRDDALQNLDRCLEEGDVAGAKELLAGVKSSESGAPVEEPVAVTA